MGVARKTIAADLVAEVVELVLAEPALQVGPGVDAGGGVALNEDLVTEAAVGLAPEEVVEANLVEGGRAGVGREVASDPLGARVGPHHHGGGVPADVGADTPLLVLVSRDGVDVRRRDRGREVDLLGAGPLQQLHEEVASARAASGIDDGIEGVEPFGGLGGVRVGNLVADPVEQHGSTVPVVAHVP